MYMSIRVIDSVSTNIHLNFGNVPTVWYLVSFFKLYKCGHRNVLSKRQVWMSIFHIINIEKKNHGYRGAGFFLTKN
jgi:hypothetical protein